VVYICNPSTQAAKAGRSQVPGQPELYSQTLSQKRKEKKGKKKGMYLLGPLTVDNPRGQTATHLTRGPLEHRLPLYKIKPEAKPRRAAGLHSID
jgi:hypothetical protein